MTDPSDDRGLVESFLAPRAYLLGVACAFAACCLTGWAVSQRNPFRDFVRFHMLMNPQTLFTPTVDQVRALARQKLDRDRIAVVVGSSILHGNGQRAEKVWTRKLQEELGDDYRVLNLGLPSAGQGEFGGTAAEVLARDYPRLIFITSTGNCGPLPPDGYSYRYFFWEAYHRNLLVKDDFRKVQLDVARLQRKDDRTFLPEIKLEMKVDRCLKSRDLWGTVAYRYVSTPWVYIVGPTWWHARKRYADPDPGDNFPFEIRNNPAQIGQRLDILRGWAQTGEAVYKGQNSPLIGGLRATFPAECRRRTMILVTPESPYYVNRLLPAERDKYRKVFTGLLPHLEEAGFTAHMVGDDYEVKDYADVTHFSESGGNKMAIQVAPYVRQMARALGYTN